MADDGRLAFDIALMDDAFQAQAERIKEQFKAIGDAAVNEGKHIDQVFADLSKGYDVSTLEARMKALLAVIAENENTVVSLNQKINKMAEDAKKALANEDYATFRKLRDDITKTQSQITDITAETANFKHVLNEVEQAAGKATSAMPTDTVRFFATEEDYNRVKELTAQIDELKAKLAEADDQEGINKINGEIITLQDELDTANAKAAQAASELGENLGGRAAEVSTRFYELNAAVKEQEKNLEELNAQLEKTASELKAAEDAGDTKKVAELQLQYQHLAESVKNTSDGLSTLKGQQKDATNEWTTMSQSLEEVETNYTSLISSAGQFSRILTTSKNPLQLFRASLIALKGGLKLVELGAKGVKGGLEAMKAALLSNPITAIIVAVAALTAGIIALVKSMKSATDRQIEMNNAQKAYLEMVQNIDKVSDDIYSDNIKDSERRVKNMKAEKKSLKEIWEEEDRIMAIRKKQAEKGAKDHKEYIRNISTNRTVLQGLERELERVTEWQAKNGNKKIEYTINGKKLRDSADKAIEAIKGKIENTNLAIEIGVKYRENFLNVLADETKQKANRVELTKQMVEAARVQQNAVEKARIELINDGYEKEKAVARQATKEKIEALKKEREAHKDNAKQVAAIDNEILLQRRLLNKRLEEIEREHQKKVLNLKRQVEDAQYGDDLGYLDMMRLYSAQLDRNIIDLKLQLNDNSLSAEEKEEIRQLIAIAEENKPIQEIRYRLTLDAQKAKDAVDALRLGMESVKEGTLEEYELQQQIIELERAAELAENRAKDTKDQKSEADINAKYDKQLADYMRSRVEVYSSYRQQMTDLLVNSENDRLVIQKQLSDEEAKAENERDNKKIEELKRKLSILTTTTEREYKDLQKELIRSSLGDVFIESTYANVKEAMKQIDELLGMSFEDFKLSPYGNDNATEADWLAFLANVRKIRSEIDDMDKGSYNLKRAFQDAFTGKTREDMEKGTQKLLDGFNKVGNVVSGLADALRDFADATNNVHLEKMADTFSEIANTISNATGYAQAGATVGGGWGAVIGAVLGIGQGVATAWLDSRTKKWAEIEEDYRKSLESINDTSAEEIFASAVEAFANSVKSLDYTNYQKSVLDLINELKKSGVESMQSWRSLYESAGPYQIIQNGTYDRDAIVKWLNDKYGGQIQFALDYLNTATGNGVNGQGYTSFEELLAVLNSDTASDTLKNLIQTVLEKYVGEDYGAILGLLESEGWSDEVFAAFSQAAIATSETVRTAFKTSYADIMNARNQQTNQERADLIKRLQELLESGSTNTLEYMNALYEADKMNLELLRERYLILKNAGQDTTEIEAQISEAEYNMANRTKDMVQALAGVDFASIVSKWGDIFKEFGTDTSAAFDKISESVDDMIANFLYQTYFVAPAMKRLNNSLSDFAKLYGIEADEEGNYNLTEEQLKNYYEYLKEIGKATAEDYEEWKRQMEALGIPIDAVNDRSATSRGIAQASQESVDELNGRMTAVEGHTFSINENTQVIRDTVLAINSNVAAIRDYTSNLVQMREDMNAMRSAIEHMDNNGVYLDTDRN